ncbi:MAG: cytochrome-c oxidase [Pseudomonas sp.]|uniref:cytochrome o ubiquinol oxidase subunit IV n=1 Tax=Pseudomonas sp. TaxID=306 RepID=UPI0011F4DDFD|nr:cytochrome C oxidase subunit IV family protein [Pseudomonas sp.]RZI76847.1 MAG: cytochrome-c oxidase [Pseudomonas sp.]
MTPDEHAAERRRETRTYLAGYAAALLLTAAAFAAVQWPRFPARTVFGIVLGLGLMQVVVQFRCFLHIGFKRSSRADLLLVLFSVLIIALMVSGTLVVIFNLRERMM